MASKFIEIDEEVFGNLEKVAAENGYPSVEKMLTDYANKFSPGCSVTTLKKCRSCAA